MSTATLPPQAAASFADLGVPSELVDVLGPAGIRRPTPIQTATLPASLAGRDVVGQAPTGSGKTVAFGLPLAARVIAGSPRHPSGLVLVPTRELATQVAHAVTPLLEVRGRRVATFFGGVGFGPQRRALAEGVDVAVACPGRLEDLRQQGCLDLGRVGFLVVDEADRMADMGFLPALRRILDATASARQTLLFSATLGRPVHDIVARYLVEPEHHAVKGADDALERMSHRFEAVDPSDRVRRCATILGPADRAVVFVRTRHGADRVSRQLARHGVRTATIHGDRSQNQRHQALAAFRSGQVQALVATDVAARGIHVDGVTCVVHFDLPSDPSDYVHRSGRTARAGARGRVVALVGPDQHAAVGALVADLHLDAELVGIVADPTRRSDAGATGRSTGARGRRPSGRGRRPSRSRTARGDRRP
jgi:superfamily II DNA/RNA helicase